MSPSRSRPFVLLVEDSDDDAFFFQRALRKTTAEIDVVRVNNGADAISFFENCANPGGRPDSFPDYVFLDLKLPVLSGFEILEWLVDRRILSKLKVAILSGSESVADVRRGAELGVKDYLVKPVPVSILRDRLFDPITGRENFSAP